MSGLWQPQRFVVRLTELGDENPTEREVYGIVRHGLGIHSTRDGKVVITHLHSGRRVGPPLDNLGSAMTAAQRIMYLYEWTGEFDPSPAVRSKISRILREAKSGMDPAAE